MDATKTHLKIYKEISTQCFPSIKTSSTFFNLLLKIKVAYLEVFFFPKAKLTSASLSAKQSFNPSPRKPTKLFFPNAAALFLYSLTIKAFCLGFA